MERCSSLRALGSLRESCRTNLRILAEPREVTRSLAVHTADSKHIQKSTRALSFWLLCSLSARLAGHSNSARSAEVMAVQTHPSVEPTNNDIPLTALPIPSTSPPGPPVSPLPTTRLLHRAPLPILLLRLDPRRRARRPHPPPRRRHGRDSPPRRRLPDQCPRAAGLALAVGGVRVQFLRREFGAGAAG